MACALNGIKTEFGSLIKRDQTVIKLATAQTPIRQGKTQFGSLIKKAWNRSSLQLHSLNLKYARVAPAVQASANVGREPF